MVVRHRDIVKAEFARLLNAAMVARGWNQSELWRQSIKHTPEGAGGITRDLVSKYLGAKSLPTPVNLEILTATLGCTVRDLFPGGLPGSSTEAEPPVSVQDRDGVAWLKINQAVEWPKALRIMAILKGDE